MELTEEMLEHFERFERYFIITLLQTGQLFITDDEKAPLPKGATHILLIKPGRAPELIRKFFY